MYQMPPNPGSPYSHAQVPTRKRVPTWAIIASVVAVGLCVICGTGAIVAVSLTNLRKIGTAVSLSPRLPASVGESLTINGVTVTLVSAKVITVAYAVGTGQPVPGVEIALHFWNQTSVHQQIFTGTWRLLIDGGSRYYSMPPQTVVSASLQPNQTQDAQFTVEMNTGDHGPYTLQTDFTTPQGQPMAWMFTG